MATIVMPLPAVDFDPTETAVPWQILSALGHSVRFATPEGEVAQADPMMLDGSGLDPWGRLPVVRHLKLLGLLLRADRSGRAAYRAMVMDPAFRAPMRWDAVLAEDMDALVLPGGHRARGMRAYLESAVLHRLTAAVFTTDKPVGAICHGVVLAARSRDGDGRSILGGRRVTALTWTQERAAHRLARVGRWWDPDYYRTYPDGPGQPAGFMSVEREVTRAVGPDGAFVHVPDDAPDVRRKTSGLHRDSAKDLRPAWVVRDGNLVTARWPGDAHAFARAVGRVLRDVAN